MLMIRKHIISYRGSGCIPACVGPPMADSRSRSQWPGLRPGAETDSRGMDIEKAASAAVERVKGISELYHRLLLIVGPVASGKTLLLRKMNGLTGYPVVNLSLELSKQMLELTERQRVIELPRRLEQLVSEKASDVVLLDDSEFLFLRELRQDALAVLKSISRNHTVVASWLGTCDGEHLMYASPGHPEFKTYSRSGLELIELRR